MSKKESQVSRLADDILMLSHLEPASDRVSWLAPGARGFEPYNEYLIRHGDKTLLLDTGVALHGEQLIASLKELVGSRELIIFITRIELDCIGNLGRVLDHFRDAQVVTANVVPPIGLVHVSAGTTPRTAIHIPMGSTLERFGFGDITINEAPIRMLGTSWPWHATSRTLFTTDFFCNDLCPTADTPAVRHDAEGRDSPQDIRRRLLRKFDWLENADTTVLEELWRALFDRIDPLALAPTQGRVQSGKDLVCQVIEDYEVAIFRRAEGEHARQRVNTEAG